MINVSHRTWRPVLFSLAFLDLLVLVGAFSLAYWLRISSGLIYFATKANLNSYIRLCALTLPLLLFIFYAVRLYDPHELFYGTMEYILVGKAVTYGIITAIVIGFLDRSAPSRGWLVLFWLLAILMVNLNRFAFRRVIRRRLRAGLGPDRVLIVGANEEARAIGERLIETGRMEVVGFLDDFNPVGQEVMRGVRIRGVPRDYEQIARRDSITHIILVGGAVGWESTQEILSASTNDNGLQISLSPGFGELSASLRISYTCYVPLLHFRPGYATSLDKFVKSGLDLILATCFIVLSLPVQISVILWILWRKGRPIFVEEEILGRSGKLFKVFSFRIGPHESALHRSFTETQEDESQLRNKTLSFENTLFKCGAHRLPLLINVILGQMSLVGPRPLTKETAHRCGIWLSRLLSVKPGLTGPWAVQKVRNLQYEISQSIAYIHAWTPWKDLQFLLLTALFTMQNFLPNLTLKGRKSRYMTDEKAAPEQNPLSSEASDFKSGTVATRYHSAAAEGRLKNHTTPRDI